MAVSLVDVTEGAGELCKTGPVISGGLGWVRLYQDNTTTRDRNTMFSPMPNTAEVSGQLYSKYLEAEKPITRMEL